MKGRTFFLMGVMMLLLWIGGFTLGLSYGRSHAVDGTKISNSCPVWSPSKEVYVVAHGCGMGMQMEGDRTLESAFAFETRDYSGGKPVDHIDVYSDQGWGQLRETCRKEGK